MNTDLSEEAFWNWVEQNGYSKTGLEVWQEAARRAEERERQAFEFGLDSNLYSDKLMNRKEVEQAWIAYQKLNHGSQTHQ